MYKRVVLKAMVLLVVMMFHSFVLVPKSHATAFEGTLARVAFRSVAPSIIAGLGSGTALVLGIPIAIGTAYLIYKSGAVTALKNWWNSTIAPYSPNPDGSDWLHKAGINGHLHVYYASGSWGWATKTGDTCTGWNPATRVCSGAVLGSAWPYGSAASAYSASGYGTAPQDQPPVVPTDYATDLASSQPDFNSSIAVYGSPGAAATVGNGAVASSYTTMSDADADALIAALGATGISDTGAQSGSPASPTDNTVSLGEAETVGLLQSIMNYVSNLVGIKTGIDQIKTSTDQVKTATDCVASGMQSVNTNIQNMTGKMDNVVTGINSQNASLDNIAQGIQSEITKLDNVAAEVHNISQTVATEQTITTRMTNLKNLCLTKFPFSFMAGIANVNVPQGGTTIIPDIILPTGEHWVVDPMQYPTIASFFGTVRTILAVGMWAMFTLIMIRRVTQL